MNSKTDPTGEYTTNRIIDIMITEAVANSLFDFHS